MAAFTAAAALVVLDCLDVATVTPELKAPAAAATGVAVVKLDRVPLARVRIALDKDGILIDHEHGFLAHGLLGQDCDGCDCHGSDSSLRCEVVYLSSHIQYM